MTVILLITAPSSDFYSQDYDASDKMRAALDDLLEEICSVSSQIEYPYLESQMRSKPTFEVVGLTDLFGTEVEEEVASRASRKHRILRVSVTGSPSSEFESQSEISESDRTGILQLLFRELVLKQIFDLLVIANISRVGSLMLRDSWVIQDGRPLRHSKVPRVDTWSLRDAVEFADSIGWPVIHTLTFLEVWRWFTKHGFCPGGFSRSRTGRSLNAFSNLLDSTKGGPGHLFWALVGIEALYTRGNAGLIQWVKEKTQVLLGQQEAHKREIGRMYDFRSRFMHGDLDFSGRFPFDESEETVGKYEEGCTKQMTWVQPY